MGDDGIGRPDRHLPSAAGPVRPGSCAIAPVRGDVTTARAAAAVRARRRDRADPQAGAAGPATGRPAGRAEATPPEVFPAHLLRAGPA